MPPIAFIHLKSAQEDTTELMVDAFSVKHIGVAAGVTFVETSAGCSYVEETPVEVFEKIAKAAEHFE